MGLSAWRQVLSQGEGGKPAERIVGYKPKAYLKQKIDAVL